MLDWGYNARGDLSGLIYPSGHQVGFDPNAHGEPRQVRHLPAGTSYASAASYHADGSLAGFTYGNATTRTVSVNSRFLPQRIHDVRSGATRLDHAFTYDANANLATLTDGLDGLESRTLVYDDRNRLTHVTGTPGSIGHELFEYDPLDNVRRAVANGVDRRFSHHATTHRLAQITTIGSPVLMDYTWNDRGELASRKRTQPGTLTITPPTIFRSGFEDTSLTYTETFAFDQARRLTSYQNVVQHAYDAHNHRVSTGSAWGMRYQVYSRSGELLYVEDSSSNQRIEFFHLSGTLVAERTRPMSTDTAVVSYLHSDHRGTPSVKTASTGSVSYRSRLMPYGAPYDGIWRDGPGFTKHATDESSELVYMQQRYYDPAMLRFLSPDPVSANASSFNVYWYANNNPYTYTDPDGRAPRDVVRGFVDGMASNFLATPSIVQVRPADLTPQPFGGVEGNLGNGSYEAGRVVADVLTTAMDVAAGVGAGMAPRAAKSLASEGKLAAPTITKAYSRPAGTPTAAQRASVQGKPCVDCGSLTAKQRADHKTPMVQEYYQTGTVNLERAKSLDAVQPQCPTCSARQGAEMSRYSKRMKKEHGL